MKRLIICFGAVGAFSMMIVEVNEEVGWFLSSRTTPINSMIWHALALFGFFVISSLLIKLFAKVWMAGAPCHSSLVLQRGQTFRLIAVSLPRKNLYIGVLAAVEPGIIRHLLIKITISEKSDILVDKKSRFLIPGHHYRYIGLDMIEPLEMGKL